MFRWEISIFVSIVLISVCTASMFFSHLPVHEETYVRHINGRLRRDAEQTGPTLFPEFRTFILTLEGKKVRLDLKLNRNMRNKVSIKLFNHGKATPFDDTAPKDYAFYQQIHPKGGSAVMVKCDNRRITACHIVGNIRVGDNEYKIEPKTQQGTLVSKVKHVVYKTSNREKGIDFSGDTKDFIIDESELESHTETKLEIRPKRHAATLLNNEDHILGTRPKRQAGQVHHEIELALVIDYSTYEYWLQRENMLMGPAINKLTQYYEVMVNDMDLRYESATTADMKIDVILLELEIIEEPSGQPWITNSFVTNGWVDASNGLDLFQNWAETRTNLSDYDVIMAVTSKDLASFSNSENQYNNGTVGLAYRFSRQRNNVVRPLALPCRRLRTSRNGPLKNYAVGIVEDFTGDMSHTLAHETAHLLGVSHDSTGTGCTYQDQFIMASGRSPYYAARAAPGNSFSFSQCSVETMSGSLQDLLTDSNTDTNADRCLQENTYNEADDERRKNLPKSGKIYSMNEQCQFAISGDSNFCPSLVPNKNSICQNGTYCSLPGSRYCRKLHVMDGTDCSNAGENKVCNKGSCVDRSVETTSTTVPTTTTTVPTTTTTVPTTTTTVPTTTSTTVPTTTSTVPTTTTTVPTTSTTVPTTTTAEPTTSTAAPTTSTAAPTTSTAAPTTSTAVPTTSTAAPITTTPQTFSCDIYCRVCIWVYQYQQGRIWSACPQWLKTYLQNLS